MPRSMKRDGENMSLIYIYTCIHCVMHDVCIGLTLYTSLRLAVVDKSAEVDGKRAMADERRNDLKGALQLLSKRSK